MCPTLETVTADIDSVGKKLTALQRRQIPSNLPKDQIFHIPWEGDGFSSTSHTFVSCEALCPLLSCFHLCTGGGEEVAQLRQQLSLSNSMGCRTIRHLQGTPVTTLPLSPVTTPISLLWPRPLPPPVTSPSLSHRTPTMIQSVLTVLTVSCKACMSLPQILICVSLPATLGFSV